MRRPPGTRSCATVARLVVGAVALIWLAPPAGAQTTTTNTDVTTTSTSESTTSTSSTVTSTSLPAGLRCSRRLLKELGQLRGALTSCQLRHARRATFDLDACMAKATDTYNAHAQHLKNCPNCVTDTEMQLGNDVVTHVGADAALFLCAPAERACARKLKVATTLAKRIGNKCRFRQVADQFNNRLVNGPSQFFHQCLSEKKTSYDTAIARVKGCDCVTPSQAAEVVPVVPEALADTANAFCGCAPTATGEGGFCGCEPTAAGEGPFCDDDTSCTKTWCDGTVCQVGNTNEGAACDDSDKCKKCVSGACSDRNVDDGNVCTDDSCDPTTGTPKHVPNTAVCADDGDCCTVDLCTNGACLHLNPPGQCDDGDPCTTDRCEKTRCAVSTNACSHVCVFSPPTCSTPCP